MNVRVRAPGHDARDVRRVHAVAALELAGAPVVGSAAHQPARAGLEVDAQRVQDGGGVEQQMRHELRAAAHVEEHVGLAVGLDVAIEPGQLVGRNEQMARVGHAVVEGLVVAVVLPETLVADGVDDAVREDLRRVDVERRAEPVHLRVARQQLTLLDLLVEGQVDLRQLREPGALAKKEGIGANQEPTCAQLD